jgi:ubiquinone/menaquinone biosynthesis C-methylase UbiE
MSIRADPEENEIHALLDLVDLTGKRVLEIGSGTGRLTWRYAGKAARVTAVEPSAQSIAIARQDIPPNLKERVEFHQVGFEEFALASDADQFDTAILSWSL